MRLRSVRGVCIHTCESFKTLTSVGIVVAHWCQLPAIVRLARSRSFCDLTIDSLSRTKPDVGTACCESAVSGISEFHVKPTLNPFVVWLLFVLYKSEGFLKLKYKDLMVHYKKR